jgi:hypothetical protein
MKPGLKPAVALLVILGLGDAAQAAPSDARR